MSKFIKNLLLESLLASGVLIIAKIISVFGALYITGTRFSILSPRDIYATATLVITDDKQLLLVNSISNGIFCAIMIIVATLVISRIYLTHVASKNQRMVAKIIYYNLVDWLESGDKIYPKLFVWTLYLWLSAILVLRDAVIGISWIQIPVVVFTFAAVYSMLIFMQLDKHIDIISLHKAHGNAQKINN